MADPARVNTEPGSDVMTTENVRQDKNAGEGSSGGNPASEKLMDQPTVKQDDKVVRCDVAHTRTDPRTGVFLSLTAYHL